MIEWGTQYLKDKEFNDARLNVEILLCHVLNCKRIDLYLKFDRILNQDELNRFKPLFQRRISHEPIQYITGETEFMGLQFEVDARVFIPRPDTEVLIEQVIKYFGKENKNKITILDIGTGSGNIPISLAKYIDNSTIDSVDISSDALEVARKNLKRHMFEGRIIFHEMDFLKSKPEHFHKSYDVIVSNPPYISAKEFKSLEPEVKDFEPKIANTDYVDGLTFYDVIAKRGKDLLNSSGVVFVEIGYDQGESVPKIFENYGYKTVDTFNDYNGIKRVVKAEIG